MRCLQMMFMTHDTWQELLGSMHERSLGARDLFGYLTWDNVEVSTLKSGGLINTIIDELV